MARVPGIDVILTSHAHDALRRPVRNLREPSAEDLARVVGRTESLLWRRGNTAGTWDDVICNALLEQRDAKITLSPGFRWGTTLLPDTDITAEDVWAQTAITYPAAYRSVMKGAAIKALLEDIPDNLFYPSHFYQQGGNMVRIGGITFSLIVAAGVGQHQSSDARPTDLRFGIPPSSQEADQYHSNP